MKRFLAGILPALFIAAIVFPVAAAPKSDISSDSENIYFSSAIPSAPPGSTILNCLGYLVSMKSADKSDIGTVFVHGSSKTGRAYYTGLDRNTGKIMKTGEGNYETEVRIPVQDIVSAFQTAYGDASAQKVESIFEKKMTGSCTVNTVMCTAKLAGNGTPSQPGWNQSLKCEDITYTELGATQVRLKQANPSASNIKSDLEILNRNSSWKKAVTQNSRLKCFEINPSQDLTSGGAVLSVTNGSDDYKQYSNLNCESAFRGLQSRPIISYSYYNLNVLFTGIQKKTVPYRPGKVGTVNYSVNPASQAPKQVGTVGETGVNYTKVLTCGIGGCLLFFLIWFLAWKTGKDAETLREKK